MAAVLQKAQLAHQNQRSSEPVMSLYQMHLYLYVCIYSKYVTLAATLWHTTFNKRFQLHTVIWPKNRSFITELTRQPI